ncbi:entericidin A/B family lipoprotein [Acidisphaera sp. L21]|jgi:entericidin B|uniref:entericidin A/B family lipoprotein n=1 Tax=Acidisphaera sp. L21 TaxID=1641851 RepID=UPI0020B148C0|nr:entericidin A/B family lipoprotein [Acidisphaera sp. L21]
MSTHRPNRPVATVAGPAAQRRVGLLGLAVVMAAGLALSGCNTTAGVGKDVSATGSAVTRGANDVKSGL